METKFIIIAVFNEDGSTESQAMIDEASDSFVVDLVIRLTEAANSGLEYSVVQRVTTVVDNELFSSVEEEGENEEPVQEGLKKYW